MPGPLNDPRSEDWFRRFNAPLRRLPAEERAALHTEVSQHLDQLAAANRELGSSPEEAWGLALTQFGDPAKIGQRLLWEWRRSRIAVTPDMAAVLYGLGMSASLFVLITAAFSLSYLIPQWERYVSEHTIPVYGIAYLLGLPLFTGWALGRRHPGQALAGSLYSALVMPVMPVLLTFEAECLFQEPMTVVAVEFSLLALTVSGAWLLAVGGAAYLASARKRRQWYWPQWSDLRLKLPTREELKQHI